MRVIKYPSVTVSGVVTTSCEKLFEIVSDVSKHSQLAGSGEVQEVRWITPPPLGVGSAFESKQQISAFAYPTRSYVQVYEPPFRFIWLTGPGFKKPPFGQLWGFDLKPLDARTTLVSNVMKTPIYPLPNIPPFTWFANVGAEHESRNMKPTLKNLARLANAQLLGEIEVIYDWRIGNLHRSQQKEATLRAA